MIPPRGPVTTALVSFFADATGRPVGDNALPTKRDAGGTLVAADLPYTILDSLDVATAGPVFGDANADATWSYQLRCVGQRRDQAEALWDRACRAWYGKGPDGAWVRPITVPGQRVWEHRGGTPAGGGVGDGAGGIVALVLRFQITTSEDATHG